MKLGTLTVTNSKSRQPCVYEYLREGIVLYVGRSDVGFSRAFVNRNDAQPNRRKAFNQATDVRVHVFSSKAETRREERRLIRLHKPQYNLVGYCDGMSKISRLPSNTAF